MKSKTLGKKQMILIVLITIFILLIVIIYGYSYKHYKSLLFELNTKREEVKELKLQVENYEKAIKENLELLKKSETNRRYLAKKIAEKVAESQNIKTPEGVKEIEERLLKLGYRAEKCEK